MPFEKIIDPEVYAEELLVPPFAIGRVPVTSEARSIVCPRLVRQTPFEATQPAVRLIPFPEKVEVAEELFRIEPPVMVRPFEEANPPPPTERPPTKVEVPEPWA